MYSILGDYEPVSWTQFLVKFNIFIILVAQLTSSMLPFLQLLSFASLLRLLIRFHSFMHIG